MTISLSKLSRITSTYAAGVLPLGSHQSLPVPCMDKDRVFVAYMYCRSEFQEAGEGLMLWPPSFVAYIDATRAKFERLVAVTPQNFERNDDREKPLGTGPTKDLLTSDGFLTQLARLYQAGDILLPRFAAGLPPDTPEYVEAVTEFKSSFSEIREPSLIPYYASLGKAFYSWIGHVM